MTIQDISLRNLSGAKGGGKVTNTSDNLFSTDVVEVLLAISEGPIKGLSGGAKDFYVGETPLKDSTNHNNFDNFELINYRGNEAGETIYSRLGGFGASTNVGTQLASGVAVIRNGSHTQIDYLDVRFVINQLLKSDKGGTFEHVGKWKIEYKLLSQAAWKPVRTSKNNPLPNQISGVDFDAFYGEEKDDDDDNKKKTVAPSPGDRPTFWSQTQPVTTANSAIWFDTNNNYKPKVYNGRAWEFPNALVFNNGYWSWREASSWGKDKSTKGFVGANLPKGAKFEQGDYWLHTGKNKPLFHNGSTWIAAGSSLRPGTFGEDSGAGGKVTLSNGEVALKAKTTQTFVKEFRIPVARADEPYMIRVTKTSPENTTELFFDISWESFQEVTAKPYKFKGLSTTQLVARASDQFTSVPDFSGIYDGRIVRVPKNYDPIARTYAGIWDGTWKMAYTNNPAYIANDIVENDRYGMNAYYPISLNKWDVYDAGMWCDVRTADGLPRFTFNALLSDPRGGRDTLNYICGLFAGRFFDDGNGTGVIKIDKNDGASRLFTPEKVVDGVFAYSFTEISTRHNDITVTFDNPELNWQEDRRRVFDQAHIDQYGRIPFNFEAVGCTNELEAVVRARHHLITGTRETMMVNFKTNRNGLYATPYDVILIADEDMEMGLSGRVKSVQGTRTLQLRDAIHLEPGYRYRISFQLISAATQDFVLETRELASNMSGSLLSLVTETDLPPLPADAAFTIEQIDGQAAPIAFRIMNIKEIDNDPDNVDITAVQIYRAKWLYIDGIVDRISDLDKLALDTKLRPGPVSEARVRAASTRINGRLVYNMVIDWDKSPSKFVARYKILAGRNNDPPVLVAESDVRQFNWTDVPAGEYVFQIIAVDAFQNESTPITLEHRFIGDLRVVEPIQTLRMVDEDQSTIFASRSPRFQWSANADPAHHEYVVQIRKLDGSIVREVSQAETQFQYEFGMNAADNGQAIRSFTISVASKDEYGFLSDFESLTVSNPPPSAPAEFTVVSKGLGTIIANTSDLPKRDVTGLVIHMSTQQGFTPTETTLAYEGKSTNVTLVAPSTGITVYLRAAFRDDFSNTDLNYTGEKSLVIPSLFGDLEPPAIPTGLDVESTVVGDVVTLVARWNANTEPDMGYYDVLIAEDGGSFIGFPTNTPLYQWTVRAGGDYQVKVRALDKIGNASGYSNVVVHSAAKDTSPPAVPTSLVAKGGFGVVWLTFARNPEPDLRRYEIFESETTTTPLPATVATFTSAAETFARQGVTGAKTLNYWVRAVDTSGNKSAWSTMVTATTVDSDLEIKPEDLDGLVSLTSFAAGITAPGLGADLPATPFTNKTPKTFYLTTDKRIYIQKSDGTGWLPDSDASLIVGKLVAGQIAVGAVGAEQISAEAIRAKHLLLADPENLIPNGGFADDGDIGDYWTPAATGGTRQLVTDNNALTGKRYLRVSKNTLGSAHITTDIRQKIDIFPGSVYTASTAVRGSAAATGGATIIVRWFDNTDTQISYSPIVENGPLTTGWVGTTQKITAPANAKYAIVRIANASSNTTALHLDVDRVVLQRSNAASLIVDGSLTANLVTAGEFITGSAQIRDAIITNAKIWDLSAAKLIAGTALAGSITVAGTALSTMQAQANDPAMRINQQATQIDPGRILISGSTTLASWRDGSDSTKINGGSISANSIEANRLRIGARGVTTVGGLDFWVDKASNILYWSTGYILYTNDANNPQGVQVGGGATTAVGYTYLFWAKGSSELLVRNDTNGSWASLVGNGDYVLMATYSGAAGLQVFYGGTIIDGTRIVTGTITAQQIGVNQVNADHINSDSIDARHIRVSTISADKITIGGVTYDRLGQRAAVYVNAVPTVAAYTLSNVYTLRTSSTAWKFDADTHLVFADCRVNCTNMAGLATAQVQYALWENNGTSDTEVAQGTLVFTETGQTQTGFLYYVRSAASGTYTYKLVMKKSNNSQTFVVGRCTSTTLVANKST